jgi:phosphatidylinositol-3-phosphatase
VKTLIAIVSCVLVFGACSSSSKSSTGAGSSTTAASASTSSSTATTTTTVPSGPTAIGHVFVINLENQNFTSTWGAGSPARYLNTTLLAQGKLLTQYYGIGHVSLDNYIAEISGQSPNPKTQSDCVSYTDFVAKGAGAPTGAYGQALGEGCQYPKSIQTIADQLSAAGKTWHGYMEDMGTPCRHPALGATDITIAPKPGDMYATRHNPFVYFHSIVDSPACVQNVVDFSHLATDLKSVATTPNLSFITPNVCHDGHDSPCVDGQPGGLVSADRWLSTEVPAILASPAYKADGMLIITFDEASISDPSACCHTPVSPNADKPGLGGPGGGRIGALVISAQVKPGTTDATPYNHYALLCSMEDMFGLTHLGFAGAPGLACFGKDVYDASS